MHTKFGLGPIRSEGRPYFLSPFACVDGHAYNLVPFKFVFTFLLRISTIKRLISPYLCILTNTQMKQLDYMACMYHTRMCSCMPKTSIYIIARQQEFCGCGLWRPATLLARTMKIGGGRREGSTKRERHLTCCRSKLERRQWKTREREEGGGGGEKRGQMQRHGKVRWEIGERPARANIRIKRIQYPGDRNAGNCNYGAQLGKNWDDDVVSLYLPIFVLPRLFPSTFPAV